MIDRGKRSVLGVLVDVVDYEGATKRIIDAATARTPMAVTALAVHGVMTGVQDADHRARLNSFDLVTPDGQPVRWALNLLHRARLRDRVYGPDLTLLVAKEAAARGVAIYLYGSQAEVLERFRAALSVDAPGIQIAGAEPSQFRLGGDDDAAAIAQRVKESGAGVVFVGLGCPRQEQFAFALRCRLDVPLLAVGAAFDYHAGSLRKPPPWMQRHGLEWLWRLVLEPRRLWRRYLLLNPAYLALLTAQTLRLWRPRTCAEPKPLAAFPI